MGFFSWMTSDTNRSIMSLPSGYGVETVYMLSPGGAAPIKEEAYAGFGVFGGVDAYVHLARMNIAPERLEGKDDDYVRLAGCALEGGYYELVSDGSKHQIFHPGAELIDPDVKLHPVTYDKPIEAFGGRSANEMITDKLLVQREFRIDHPLKFAHDPAAVYEDLAASEDCPCQGFFGRGEEEDS